MSSPSAGAVEAVFFDLADTLAGFQPSQEAVLVEVCREFGLAISSRDARRGFLAAGDYWRRAVARRSLERRTAEQQQALYREFDRRVLTAAGVPVGRGLAYRIFQSLMERSEAAGSRLVLYDDTLPALAALKACGLKLGVISNVPEGLPQLCDDLGLSPWLDVIVGPAEATAEKPNPRIFRMAMRRVGVAPRAAVYVGNNPTIDVAGARRAGMRPVLLDRLRACVGSEVDVHITSLAELMALVVNAR